MDHARLMKLYVPVISLFFKYIVKVLWSKLVNITMFI